LKIEYRRTSHISNCTTIIINYNYTKERSKQCIQRCRNTMDRI
jgi:hypothetical protein